MSETKEPPSPNLHERGAGLPLPSSSESGSDEDFKIISVSDRPQRASSKICAPSKVPPVTPADQFITPLESQRATSAEEGEQNAGPTDHQRAHTAIFANNQLTAWVQSAVATQRETGLTFSDMVRRNRNFRNPAIFEKMISFCGIDEFGSELPKRLVLEKGDFYEDIAEFQEVCMQKRV
eukprot:GFKZ01006264.1.p2 GENE.GFKZ01006264.1~~GFKZ01006264.1.p2  ORF type:complete len:179 (+),score=27.09 GFKZ01006264.1:849-1385(+)